MTKPAKPKTVNYELILRESIVGHPMYALLDELVETHHEELTEARIALAWNLSWKPDVDGRITIGKCVKASDLDRELALYDFTILLLKGLWCDSRTTDRQRRALLDHELHHCAVKYDKAGEPVIDERGRRVYRLRRHDLEEFTAVVARHGLYKRDLEQFADACRQHLPKWEPCLVCVDSPGWVAVVDEGVSKVVRCDCWVRWAQERSHWNEQPAGATA